jgi:hypothetical protein
MRSHNSSNRYVASRRCREIYVPRRVTWKPDFGGQAVIDEWSQQIDGVDLDCERA